jgi:TetR/AcrR family transcriptional regulator
VNPIDAHVCSGRSAAAASELGCPRQFVDRGVLSSRLAVQKKLREQFARAQMASKTSKSSQSKPRSAAAKPRAAEGRAKPRTRVERLEVTRAGILQSALEHFARFGFEGASIRNIAAQTGVTHGMIRHVYGTKEVLWHEAITFLFRRLDSEVNLDAEVQAGLSDRELFTTYVHRYVRYCAKHPEHARIMIQQSSLDGPQIEWATKRFIRARHVVSSGVIERLMAAGSLPDVDPVSLAFSLAASCQMYFVLAPEVKALSGRNVYLPDEVDRHAQSVVRLFLRS